MEKLNDTAPAVKSVVQLDEWAWTAELTAAPGGPAPFRLDTRHTGRWCRLYFTGAAPVRRGGPGGGWWVRARFVLVSGTAPDSDTRGWIKVA
jgi:hypothetical protein